MAFEREVEPLLQEIRQFRAEHPGIDHVDLITLSLAGRFFGKRYPIDQLEKLAHGGVKFPRYQHLSNSRGEPVPVLGIGAGDGDPDALHFPVPGSLVPVGWSTVPVAQMLVSQKVLDTGLQLEPRTLLKRVLERLQQDGMHPVVAFEPEFYLLQPELTTEGFIQPPRDRFSAFDNRAVLGMDRLNQFGSCLHDVAANCAQQGMQTGAVSAEWGTGQYEINLSHQEDGLRAADHCAMFRRVVEGVAGKHGYRASFMAKPFLDQAGSGMHLHVSLYDGQERNVLVDKRQLLHAIGGLLDLLPQSMPVLCPEKNAFRRMQPGNSTAVSASWGYENRTVAVRVPDSDEANRRIEHRVGAASANPYLVLAVVLAGINHGLSNAVQPAAPKTDSVNEPATLPATMPIAIQEMEASEGLRDYIGAEFLEMFCAYKRAELAVFENFISAREYEWYL